MTQSGKTVHIYSDGGARGNPGPAALGVVIYDQTENTRYLHKKYLGRTTNNQAEYQALIAGLCKAQELRATHVLCFLDSQLIEKQMKGEYRVKDAGLKILFARAQTLATGFKEISFTHIPREKNKEADALVNQALDEYSV